MSSLFSIGNLELKDEETPLLTRTLINQQQIEKNGNSIPISNLVLLPQVLASLDLPPNATTLLIKDTILIEGLTTPTTNNTINNQSITINDSINGGPINTITQGDMTIQDNTATNISQTTADYIQFTVPSYQSQLSGTQLSVSDVANGYSSQISSGLGLFNDTNGGSPLQVEIVADHTQDADPFIRLQNVNGLNNRIKYSGIYADGHYCFNLNNDNKFFKQQNAFSMQQYELFDGEYIEKYMPLIFAQNVNTLKLRDYTEYLDDNGLVGWTIIVSNYSNFDLNIDAFGLRWYAHNGGLSTSPIVVKKWVTVRITLVYSSIDNEYLYAVSQF